MKHRAGVFGGGPEGGVLSFPKIPEIPEKTPMVSPNGDFEDKNSQSINIELPEAVAEGTYANLFLVAHSGSEFILDCARILPGPPKGKVQARIVMTPAHAKSLAALLQQNIAQYERNFGPIGPFMPGAPGMPGQMPEDF
jgi:hypothetical protein